MFKRNGDDNSIIYSSECNKCGCKIKIKIEKTSGGFGLLGGILHESESKELHAECIDCYKSQGPMSGVTKQKTVATANSAVK